MSIHRRNAKRDKNERLIISALTKAGCLVWQLNDPGMPDLLVLNPSGFLVLLEVKSERGKLTEAQKKRRAEGLPFTVVRTIKEALDACGVMLA